MSQYTEEEINNMSPEQIAELQKQNCIFCKIIAGDIPSKKVYEDDNFIGILDINPAAQGHVLLLPKQHVQIMPQMPPDKLGLMAIACQNVSNKIIKGFAVEGTTIFAASGLVAGQKAPHFMVHIIPRKENDGLNLNPESKNIPETEYSAIKKKLLTQIYGSSQPPQAQVIPTQPVIKKVEQPRAEEVEEQEPEKLENEMNSESNEDIEEYDSENESDDLKEDDSKESDSNQENAPQESDNEDEDDDSEVDLDKISELFG